MTGFKPYFWLLCLFLGIPAWGQNGLPATVDEFGTGMKDILHRTGKEAALASGDGFEVVWDGLSLDNQRKIMDACNTIREKKYPIYPHISVYLQSIVYSLDQERVSAAVLTDYLNVTNKVLETTDRDKFLQYLRTMSGFFERHALYISPRNRLNVYNDEYTIEFIDLNAGFTDPYADTSYSDSLWYNDPYYVDTSYNYDPYYYDTSYYQDPYAPIEDIPSEPAILKPDVYLPIEEGPIIRFSKADLNIATFYDSAFIRNTSGFFSLNDLSFTGNGGEIDWSTTGPGGEQIYAEIEDYTFDTRETKLLAVDARLHFDSLTSKTVEGYLEFESVRHDSTVAPRFPAFTSYLADNELRISDDPAVSFRGGLSLKGQKVSTYNRMKQKGRLEVLGNTGNRVTFRAVEFNLGDSTISSEHASMSLVHKRDSIYHPSVRFLYRYGSKELWVSREKGRYKDTPYTSSFFSMNIKTEDLLWDLDTDSVNLNIRNGKTLVPTVLASNNHFEQQDYWSLKGHLTFNPLGSLVAYYKETGQTEFYLVEASSMFKLNLRAFSGAAEMLKYKGLVEYDSESGWIKLLPQAISMVDASFGDADYDDIILESVMDENPTAPNATVYLEEEKIIVRGVENLSVSDSLNVNIYPDSATITVLKNRDIKFDGIITAGNFEYIGRDFTFKYDSFLVNMGVIESVQLFMTDSLGNRSQIDSRLVGLDSAAAAVAGIDAGANQTSGTLYINEPSNKSAKIKYPNYPNFNAGMGAVVYFDRPEILNGIYDKSIFFVAPPFDIDSLNAADPGSIQFDGVFASSGIFPVFQEKLLRQPDNSMGFNHQIPEGGYPLYEGQGKLTGDIKLNKGGLRSNGMIDFLTTTLVSSDFTFYPDSVTGTGEQAIMQEEEINGLIYPAADFSNYRLKWIPRVDSMYIYNMGDPFQFYNGIAALDGVAIVSDLGVRGRGTLKSLGSNAVSNRINFNHDSYSARNAEFTLESDDPDKPTLAASDVRVDFDLVNNEADIQPEVVGDDALTFPYAQFKTSIPDARWDLTEKKIYMSKPPDIDIEDSYFYTTRADLDSLSFNATSAIYDIENLELTVSGIPYIEVADAQIIPDGNQVLILENATIGTLSNTVINLDRYSFHHRLYDGVINIRSRNEFSGYATYELVNATLDTFAIKMEDFRLEEFEPESGGRRGEKELHTVANGVVVEEDRILISPGMYYKGDVKLEAHNPMLKLDGYLKLNLTKIPNYNTWIRYSHAANQEKISIDFDNSLTEGGKVISAGLYFDGFDNDLYSIFVDDPRNPEDEIFFRPSGELYYDEDSSIFVIEDPLKASGERLSGKVFRYNEETSEVTFEGPMEFFPGTRQANINSSMIGSGRLDSSYFELNTFMAIDFDVDRQIWDIMAFNLMDVIQNLGAPNGLGDPTLLLYKVAEIMGERATRDYEQRTLQEVVSLAGFTSETSVPMVFADVNLKWSSGHSSFYSEGLLGMSNILGNDVNGAWEGFMEIRKNEDGSPVFNLFFKAASDSWYYLSYEDDRLMLFSSLEEFNEEVTKRSNAAKAKIGDLVFIPGDRSEAQNFVDTFRYKYYGIDESYVLDAEAVLDDENAKKKKEVKSDDGF